MGRLWPFQASLVMRSCPLSLGAVLTLIGLHAASTAGTQGPTPPYPPSPVIRSLEWAAADTIVRRAEDGDNWPLTWADDDALYTTWGDGTGFVPKVEKKLGCGFARVTGSPADFTGVNIRSGAEQL